MTESPPDEEDRDTGLELFTNGASFILDQPTEVPTVWGTSASALWAVGEALMIVGPNGVGKTTLTVQLVAARLGLVHDVLGQPVQESASRVLYLACDRPRQIARAMGRIFTTEHRPVLDKRLVVWEGPPPRDFAKDTNLLTAMCAKAGADTVIVDSLKDVAIGLSEDAVGAGYNLARQRAIRSGVEVLELHHQKKSSSGGGRPDTLADVYGSTWITAGAGSIVLLWGEAGDPIVELKHLKQPTEEFGPHRVLHDHHAGTSAISDATDLFTLARANPRGLTAQAFACVLFESEKPNRSQIEKARRKLDSKVRSGDMHAVEGHMGGTGGTDPKRYFLTTIREVSA